MKPEERITGETGQMGEQNAPKSSKGFKLWPYVVGIVLLGGLLIAIFG